MTGHPDPGQNQEAKLPISLPAAQKARFELGHFTAVSV